MDFQNFFFFDIETTSKRASLFDLKMNDTLGADIFIKKCEKMKNYSSSEWIDKPCDELYIEKAPILPEFGKIICMSFGVYVENKRHVRTIVDKDEERLMKRIANVIDKASQSKKVLCGFGIKTFDVPWIVRKLYKYGIDIPRSINFYGVKPWEISMIDIQEVWKGNGKYNITMEEVAHDLDIESSKTILSGDKVHDFYWGKNDIDSIVSYCEGDVGCLMKITEKLKL